MTGVATDNSEIGDDKITVGLNAKEYLDNKNNGSLSFKLYHFPEDSYLLPISTKISRGSSLYITGYLSIIEDLFLVRITQINFFESTHSSSHKSSSYAWEKKETDDSSIQQSSTSSITEIAKSLSAKSKKRGKHKESVLSRPQKIPKLSSLSLPRSTNEDEILQNEPFSQLNKNSDDLHDESLINDNTGDMQENEMHQPKQRRGRNKK